jgi:two-component system, OmpR family, alkaline phosphatase synthesis response regulator PhoP
MKIYFDALDSESYEVMTGTQRVLVVDDDSEITRLLRAYLEQAGFQVMVAHNGETALHMMRRESPNLVLLDLMLPDRDGWDVTRVARGDVNLQVIPLIMITARIDDTDKIIGLELGADDYITKPFNPREVVARVRSVLRRASADLGQARSSVLEMDGLRLDLAQHQLQRDSESIDVTPTEFNLLRILMENPGYAFTRAELVEKLFGYDHEGLERTLDSHVKNLRRKIESNPTQPRYIQTVYGVGYRFARSA